jgi:hypothetical protein
VVALPPSASTASRRVRAATTPRRCPAL